MACPSRGIGFWDGRVTIDDPDGLDVRSLVSARYHGTAMASLIIHGDRNEIDTPLSRLIHVHPVMYAPESGSVERFRPDRLLVDTVYRAVMRMKEGVGGALPSAPEVFIVNLSLGDTRRPYAGWISPWARLLDHLAHRYGILFVVSAGNITQPLPVSGFDTMTGFEDAEESAREDAVLDGLGKQRSQRTLLSPSEALNVVTVGASHDEAPGGGLGGMGTGPLVAPYVNGALPNISSAMGLGHRKVIKPDILMPGGREHVLASPHGGQLQLRPGDPGSRFGIRAAAPHAAGGLDRETNTGGTSVAAALTTRAAHRLYDALMAPENGGVLADAEPEHRAVVVRALLVHAARWDESVASKLGNLYGPHGRGNACRAAGQRRPHPGLRLSADRGRDDLHGPQGNNGRLRADRERADGRLSPAAPAQPFARRGAPNTHGDSGLVLSRQRAAPGLSDGEA